jgi:hypothetical protein
MASRPFPTVETYRGVGIHDLQSRERIETVVKPAIDAIHVENDLERLFNYAGNPANPPEARLFARAKCQAAYEIAAQSRVARPDIDLDKLQAMTCGLSSGWMSPWSYASLLDVRRPGDDPRAPAPRPPEYRVLAWKGRSRDAD